jgi:uncharacterized protein YndB with AHSA1/START domain
MKPTYSINPNFDLVLERKADVKPELVWKAWTEPKHLMKWFCPLPWKTVECEIDLRPGGKFNTVMEGPEGQRMPGSGCFLEIEAGRKLVWTSALLPGYRPQPKPQMPFTAIILIEPDGSGTKYTAMVIHKDEADFEAHKKMGFSEGWGSAFDQLVELAKKGSLD